MKKIALMSSIVMFVSITASAQAHADTWWTNWISEETQAAWCGWYGAVSGGACKGDFCDNMALRCTSVGLDSSNAYWSRYFSEEGQNYEECFGGNGLVTGVDCNGSNCDSLSLFCVKPEPGRVLDNCYWTPSISDETWFTEFGENQFATGMKCTGRYCDNVSFRVCTLH